MSFFPPCQSSPVHFPLQTFLAALSIKLLMEFKAGAIRPPVGGLSQSPADLCVNSNEGQGLIEDQPEEPGNTKLVVILIHGTFEPGASWPRPNSTFSRSLLCCLPTGTVIQDLRWSGVNAHSARLDASKNLQSLLVKLRTEHPLADLVCIGHSHGGSIISLALGDSVVEESLLGYGFLPTPFLAFHSRRKLHFDFLDLLPGILLVTIPSYALAFWLQLNLLMAALCLLVVASPLIMVLKKGIAKRQRAAAAFMAEIPIPLSVSEKALIVRTDGDEPGNLFSSIYLLSWLQGRSQLAAERYAKTRESEFAKYKTTIQGLLALLRPLLILMATALWTGTSALLNLFSFWLVFGWEIARHSLFLEVTAEPTPPGKWTLWQLGPSQSPESTEMNGLAHSSYGHPEMTPLLGDWICHLLHRKHSRPSELSSS